jgi:hypothetical protein
MRLYTALQARLAKIANIGEYTFYVESSGIECIDEWIVAAITFPEGNNDQSVIVANIALYKLTGTSVVDLHCRVNDRTQQITLLFVQRALEG